MAIGNASAGKSLIQSTVRLASSLFARQSTEVFLTGASAYFSALRGAGWSPTLDQEARCAAASVERLDDFLIIDAGANVGEWSKAFRQHIPTRGRILAFEPQPAAAAQIRSLGLQNCEVLEMALGERPGPCTFFTENDTDTTGSLFKRRDSFAGKASSSLEVVVTRLDDLVAERNIGCIDFMKMDLEGGELAALKGATECLGSGILKRFSFEFGTSNINSRVFFKDLYELIAENKYELFRITPAGRMISIRSYTEDQEQFARTTTYMARMGRSSN